MPDERVWHLLEDHAGQRRDARSPAIAPATSDEDSLLPASVQQHGRVSWLLVRTVLGVKSVGAICAAPSIGLSLFPEAQDRWCRPSRVVQIPRRRHDR